MTIRGPLVQSPDREQDRPLPACDDLLVMLDADGRILRISVATQRLLGITDPAALLGESALLAVHPADLEKAVDALAACLDAPGIAHSTVIRARPLEGPWRTLDLSVRNRLDDAGVGAVVVTGRDATDDRREVLVGTFEAKLLDTLPTAIVVTDDAGVVVYWNDRASSLYGYAPDEALGQPIVELSMKAPLDIRDGLLAEVAERGRWEGEYVTQRKDGTPLPILVTLERVDLPQIGFRGVLGTAIDNTERRNLQDTLAHQALHDPLTGLPNRALFLDRLDQALNRLHRTPGTLALFFLDLDRFKLVNDTCGHQAGDEVLRAVAARLEAALRPEDTVARLGGDEFAICCEQVDGPTQALLLAERMSAVLAQPFVAAGREFVVTPSIGVVLGTGAPGETGATLLRDADAAMYHAKERGRGRIELFDNGMREEVLRRTEIASQLRHALDRGELALHYQPLVDLGSGCLTGFEALLRWEHPERGLLHPSEFIEIAEETNLIAPIGRWALGQAVAQLDAWRDELPEHPITISVNLSARQLLDDALVPTVRAVLAASQLEPSRLCLEITESVLMDDAEVSVVTLRALKSLGVQLAIDDFGTAYSSLAYLKRFPVDFLKIDRCFVAGVDREPEDAVIVKAVTELGHALGLTVVAEGVETDSQLEELRRIGCDQAQGYRWAVPCPPAEALGLMRGWAGDLSPTVEAAASAGEVTVLSSTELLSVLTHELVTPLTVVKGQCERLAGMVAGVPGVPGAAEAVAAVARGAERIAHLVDTLSEAHQLETGTIPLWATPFDVAGLVHDVVPLVVPPDRPVVVVGESLEVEADPRRVEQILVNLLSNADKFSPPGSPVLVSVEAVGDRVCVVVADEGPGVPAHRVADIFRKFARLERTTKGLGLGLFISRCLARAQGGELSYRRRLPVGSALVLQLPRAAAQPAKR